jgi:predicted ATPase/DNA-binding SARP family transcriptional activator
MSLKIYLLGQFKLQVGDWPIELPSRPAQSLLAYLALNAGVTHRREKLASLLWPEATESNARSYLRQALWRTRKYLETGSLNWENYLRISDISVCFDDNSDYWLDACVFLESLEGRPVEEIVKVIQLYRGELLPGFYDEWIVPERDRLEAAYLQKMNLLLESLVRMERWEEVLKWGEQSLRLGHSPEPAFRALLSAYAGLGDYGMVSATYQRCVESLDRELGLGPSLKTRRLYEQILRGEEDGFVKAPTPGPDSVDREPSFLDMDEPPQVEKPVFVARKYELSKLASFLSLAEASQGRVIFITGETGSGKTALVNEFTRRAQSDHANLIVASGNCNAHTGVGDPYLPFREILQLLTGDVEARWAAGAISGEHAHLLWNTLPVAAQALVESGPNLIDTFVPGAALLDRAKTHAPAEEEWLVRLNELVEGKVHSTIGPSPQQRDFLEQYARVLQALARRFLLLLVVDDLQWADLGSISLLFHLGRHIAGSRILVVGAYRPEEIALGRDGARHPLEPVVNELQRDFGDITVDLGQAENRPFLDAILDSEQNQLGDAFREMLFRQTGGQPLFTIELLRGMQDRGDLVQETGGQWVEGPELDWQTLPARVEAVIAERIGRLDSSLRDLLRVASVEGESFTAEVVARVCAADERELFGHLSDDLDRKHRLIRAQSIVRLDGQLISHYRFRHILFQKYLYGSLDRVERVHLHEQVGRVLEGLYGSQEEIATVAVQLARHFQYAGITEKAIYYLHQAGNRAMHLSAYQEAVAHLTGALAILLELPDSLERAQQELALQLSLGIALKVDLPDPESERVFSRARELCLQTGNTVQWCQVLGELMIIHYVRAEYQKARELGAEALDLAQEAGDPLLVAMGHWHLGFLFFALGEYVTSRTHLEQVISFYEPQEHHQPLVLLRGSDVGVSALAYDACCLWCLGYPEKALQRSQEALALARELDHAFSTVDVLRYAGCILDQLRGDAPKLRDHAEQLVRISKGKGFASFEAQGLCDRGYALAKLGKVHEGIEQLRHGLMALRSIGARICNTQVLEELAESQAMAGQPEEGLATLAEALDLVDETDERYFEAELYRLRGELQLIVGDEVEAEKSLLKAIEVAGRQEAKSWELRAKIDLARLWQKQSRREEAREMLTQIYGWFEEGFEEPDLKAARALLEELC